MKRLRCSIVNSSLHCFKFVKLNRSILCKSDFKYHFCWIVEMCWLSCPVYIVLEFVDTLWKIMPASVWTVVHSCNSWVVSVEFWISCGFVCIWFNSKIYLTAFKFFKQNCIKLFSNSTIVERHANMWNPFFCSMFELRFVVHIFLYFIAT